jgi:hypothetical protein
MADTYPRSAGDQISYGYRQLPSAGPAGGPDLKTVVCAGVGIFLGILVGTSVADGSWRSFNPMAQHHSAQVSSNNPGSANRTVTKPAPTPPPQTLAMKQASSQPSSDQKITAATASVTPASVASLSAAPKTASPTSAAPAPVASASVASAASPILKVSVTQRASAIHKHRLIHSVAFWKRYLARRKAHSRHRMHVPIKTPAVAKLSTTLQALKPADPSVPPAFNRQSAFTVQGEVTVASYDPSAGTIDTYEGETFALDETAGAIGAIPWGGAVPNVQYTCDQFRNCTLTRDGRVVLNAKRTK